MTDQEQSVMDGLVAAWNAFVALPVEHGDDVGEFRRHIHAAQFMILARPERRAQWGQHEPV